MKDFIIEVSSLYQKASDTKNDNPKIRRGRSHSIASETEDLFATFITKADKNVDMLCVDQPITIPTTAINGKKSFQRYPDMVIVKNGYITALIDLKMDLGWNRDGLAKTCKKHFRTVQLAKGGIGKLRDGKTKEKQELKFSKELTYSIVIVSGTNISQEKLNRQISESNSLSPKVHVYVLSDGLHPNDYWRSCQTDKEKLVIYQDEFNSLMRRIK